MKLQVMKTSTKAYYNTQNYTQTHRGYVTFYYSILTLLFK